MQQAGIYTDLQKCLKTHKRILKPPVLYRIGAPCAIGPRTQDLWRSPVVSGSGVLAVDSPKSCGFWVEASVYSSTSCKWLGYVEFVGQVNTSSLCYVPQTVPEQLLQCGFPGDCNKMIHDVHFTFGFKAGADQHIKASWSRRIHLCSMNVQKYADWLFSQKLHLLISLILNHRGQKFKRTRLYLTGIKSCKPQSLHCTQTNTPLPALSPTLFGTSNIQFIHEVTTV